MDEDIADIKARTAESQRRLDDLIKQNEEQEKRNERLNRLANALQVISSIGAVILSVIVLSFSLRPGPSLTARVQTLEQTLSDNRNWVETFGLTDLEQRIQQLDERFNALSEVTDESALNLQLTDLQAEITSINSKIDSIETVILEDPVRALQITLLNRDLEIIRTDLGDIREEVNRVLDQNRWFIGLMFTLALGLIGLVIKR